MYWANYDQYSYRLQRNSQYQCDYDENIRSLEFYSLDRYLVSREHSYQIILYWIAGSGFSQLQQNTTGWTPNLMCNLGAINETLSQIWRKSHGFCREMQGWKSIFGQFYPMFWLLTLSVASDSMNSKFVLHFNLRLQNIQTKFVGN